MVQSEIRTLPVYDEGQVRGFVTEDDIIHEAVRGRWGDDKVTEIFTKRVVVVDDENSVGRVLSRFRDLAS